MCRIFGCFGKSIPQNIMDNVSKVQKNGGPDSQTFSHGASWAIGCNRLIIQGINDGIQPYSNGRIIAVFNGEIYNHKELKNYLSKKGYTINEKCDGSVIIPLYQLFGDSFAEYLEGMFSIAIIDNSEKILLVNDPTATKSLYYYHDKNSNAIYYSSELEGLFAFEIPQTIRKEAIDEYIIGRALWNSSTFYNNIYCLEPAQTVTFSSSGIFSISHYEKQTAFEDFNFVSESEAVKFFKKFIDAEVMKMADADFPICSVLSGGLDSSYITSIASKHISDLNCFNISYDGNWPFDETEYAKEVAKSLGIKYNQVKISEYEFPDLIANTIHALGQPNSAPHSVSTFALFSAIHKSGFRVALTGEGADEFFSGYDRFREAAFSISENWIDTYFDKMCATTKNIRTRIYSPDYRQSVLRSDFLEGAKNRIENEVKITGSRLRSILLFDQKNRFPSYILKRVDHLSMANSVEVRVPFCQPGIVDFSRKIPEKYLIDEKRVKKILYLAAADSLPVSVLNRPKQPFTLPITAMLKKGHILFEIMNDTLKSSSFINRPYFNYREVNKIIDEQTSKASNELSNVLWTIMILELWLKSKKI